MLGPLLWVGCRESAVPPVLLPIDVPPPRVAADTPREVVVRAEDPDSDTLELTATGTLSPAVTLDPDGLATFTVTPPLGPHELRLEVTDPDGLSAGVVLTFEAVEPDADGDGFVDLGLGGDDCDDADPEVYPGREERCDEVDQDCDGTVDDDPVDGEPWFPDADGDGWGDDATPISACEQPIPGAVQVGGDCDDAEDLRHPHRTIAGLPACRGFARTFEWLGETVDDRAGDNVREAGDVDGDGRSDVLVGAPFYGSSAGAVYLVRPLGPGKSSLAGAAAKLTGAAAGDTVGYDLAAVGDVDHDGLADVWIGAPGVGGGDGAAYLVGGPLTGVALANDAARAIVRGVDGEGLGAVASALDLDGDGAVDLLLGSVTSADGAGRVAVLPSTVTGDIDVELVATTWFVGEAGNEAGDPASAGDLDGDGIDELVVGAQGDATYGVDNGGVYVVRGPLPPGVVSAADADARWLGRPGAIAGHSTDGVGDVDGDGLGDLLVGAPYDAPNGAKSGTAYLVTGPGPDGASDLEGTATVKFRGPLEGIRAGFSVSRGYDLDGDGADDLVIGAKYDDTVAVDAGTVYVVRGPVAPGTYDLALADQEVLGQAAGDLFGDVAAAPDIDGDGRADLIVGARHHAEAGFDAGAAYVLFGGPFD